MRNYWRNSVDSYTWENNEYLMQASSYIPAEHQPILLALEHFESGYTEDGRQMPEGWEDQLGLFLRLREIIVVIDEF